MAKTSKCTRCGKRKPLEAFYRSNQTLSGREGQCRECRKDRVKQSVATITGQARMMLCEAKRRARKRKIRFALTREWLMPKLQAGRCEATNLPFVYRVRDGRRRRRMLAPSIDRIDSTKGYTPDNCQVVVYAYNCCKLAGCDETAEAMCLSLCSVYLQRQAEAIIKRMEGK